MSVIAEDIRAFLLADANISSDVGGARIEQNKQIEKYEGMFIWYARSGNGQERSLDDAAGAAHFRELFDLDVVGLDVAAVDALGKRIRDKDATRGTFGAGTIQGLFVTDQADDYIPRAVGADDGFHIASMQLEIFGYTAGA